MANKNNATCSICGKEYYVCMSCRDSIKLQPWKVYTDTSECYKVFQIVRGFNTGIYDKDEAKDKLANISLKDVDAFRPHIKQIIKDILKEENPVVDEAIEEVSVAEKTIASYKKNYKLNKVEVNEQKDEVAKTE